jgi:hypothetical protein
MVANTRCHGPHCAILKAQEDTCHITRDAAIGHDNPATCKQDLGCSPQLDRRCFFSLRVVGVLPNPQPLLFDIDVEHDLS